MNILLISNLYEPYGRGGAEVIVKRTVDALLAQGHRVSVLTACPYSGLASLRPHMTDEAGVRVWRFYPLNLFFYGNIDRHTLATRVFWHAFDLFNPHAAKVAKQVMATEKPDLVITHNLMGLGYAIPGKIKAAKVKHVHVLHDIQLAVRSGLMRQGEEAARLGKISQAYQAITRRLFASPDVVLSPSRFLLRFYQERGFFPASSAQVLQNPIDPRFFQTSLKRQAATEYHFAFIGQLVAHKGLHVLQQAFHRVGEETARLHVIGDGPLRAQVEAWAKSDPRLRVHGKIANADLPSLLATMDCVVLPTLTYENSPTVVFESLASGVPVIVCDIGGAAEAIVSPSLGLRIAANNVEALGQALKQLLASKGQRGAMANACRQAVQGLDSQHYIDALLKQI